MPPAGRYQYEIRLGSAPLVPSAAPLLRHFAHNEKKNCFIYYIQTWCLLLLLIEGFLLNARAYWKYYQFVSVKISICSQCKWSFYYYNSSYVQHGWRLEIAFTGRCSYQIMNRYEIFHPFAPYSKRPIRRTVNYFGLPDYDVYSLQCEPEAWSNPPRNYV